METTDAKVEIKFGTSLRVNYLLISHKIIFDPIARIDGSYRATKVAPTN